MRVHDFLLPCAYTARDIRRGRYNIVDMAGPALCQMAMAPVKKGAVLSITSALALWQVGALSALPWILDHILFIMFQRS